MYKLPKQNKKNAVKQQARKMATKKVAKKPTKKVMKAPSAASKRGFSTEIPKVDFQPNSSRLLVKKDVIEKPKTQSGILLPQSANKNQQQLATVVAVGPGLRTNDGKYVPTFCRVGDRVVLPDFGGMELKFNDEVFNIYRDDDIIGVVGNIDVKSRVEQV